MSPSMAMMTPRWGWVGLVFGLDGGAFRGGEMRLWARSLRYQGISIMMLSADLPAASWAWREFLGGWSVVVGAFEGREPLGGGGGGGGGCMDPPLRGGGPVH